VRRGLARRKRESVEIIGIDETSFQRRHEYVTVVTDLHRSRVLYVADGRGQESINGFFETQSREQLSALKGIALDMWDAYVQSRSIASKIGFSPESFPRVVRSGFTSQCRSSNS
jgi:transposase